MRLEQIPIVLGVLVALIGALLAYDSFRPGTLRPFRERRRRVRSPVNRIGQVLIAGGMLCMSAALAGRDTWRWGTLSVIFGAVLLLSGGLMNRTYLKEMLLFRGAARRSDAAEKIANPNEAPPKRNRIR
jgi:hypothetical protein